MALVLWSGVRGDVRLCNCALPEVGTGTPLGSHLGDPDAGAHPTEAVLRGHFVCTELARRVFHLGGVSVVRRLGPVFGGGGLGDVGVHHGPVPELKARAPLHGVHADTSSNVLETVVCR